MNITKSIFTKNKCYKTGKTQQVKGVMWHSTGANNPYLSRYIPDDGIVGPNKYNNHWNQPTPDGRSVCVHGWIGYIKDKKDIRVYQTLPWNHVGWHSGVGPKGSANTRGYVGFEICEDDLKSKEYFDKVYKLGVELTAHLCKTYNIPVNSTTIIDHTGGHKLGIASNHGDVMHWFRRYGKTMEDVRSDVKKLLANGSSTPITTVPSSTSKSDLSAKEIRIKHRGKDIKVVGIHKNVNNGLTQYIAVRDLETLGYEVRWTPTHTELIKSNEFRAFNLNMTYVLDSVTESLVTIKHGPKISKLSGLKLVDDYGNATAFIAVSNLSTIGFTIKWDPVTKSILVD